ncbi:hypothetical protein [Citricoccus sp.]|uniref:hypothetical protein n=1 Tax=Citricoccus sp. TaxID=1978372 RepID=UPI00260C0B1A|nr:hypothetical protein [Citricoccus sp.]HRO29614.1 hypothetical protein [Citricoccus sp.]HRO93568.1 hypothetical protein [Citricoccus sp.]
MTGTTNDLTRHDGRGGRAGARGLDRLATVLTEAASPFVLVAVVLVVVAVHTDPHWARSALLTVVPIAVVPQAISLVMTHRKVVTDKFIVHRTQRHLFYALALGSILLGAALAFLVPTGTVMRAAVVLAVGTLLVVMALNTRIKVSVHALIGALTAVVVPAVAGAWTLLAVLVPLWFGVSWSRVRLARHEPAEVVLGSIVGIVVGLAFCGWTGVAG